MNGFFDDLMESVQEMNEVLRDERQHSRRFIVDGELTFEQKQAHHDKVRRSNCLASLHLAGFDTSLADLDHPLLTREEALAKYQLDAPPHFAPSLPPKPVDQ